MDDRVHRPASQIQSAQHSRVSSNDMGKAIEPLHPIGDIYCARKAENEAKADASSSERLSVHVSLVVFLCPNAVWFKTTVTAKQSALSCTLMVPNRLSFTARI